MSVAPRVIGEGTYGCVHKPSLKCKRGKRNYTHKISKILKKRNAKEEMSEFKQVDSIDKQHKYHLGTPISCVPKEDSTTLSAIRKCANADKYMNNSILLVMEDGGINLKQFADKMANQPANKETEEKMETFWKEGIRMILAIKLFLSKQFIHHDLKPENIVYDEIKRRMNLIDFGFLTRFSTIRKESAKSDNWLSQMHWSYPPEIHFYNKDTFLKYANETDKGKRQFVQEIRSKDKNVYTDAFRGFFSYVISPHLSTSEYDKMASSYFYHFEQMLLSIKSSDYVKFINTSMKTIDIYGLGIAFMYVLNHTEKMIRPALKRDLEELFEKMITSNVLERIQIDDLLQKYNSILEIHGVTPKSLQV